MGGSLVREVTMIGTLLVFVCALAIALIGCEAIDG